MRQELSQINEQYTKLRKSKESIVSYNQKCERLRELRKMMQSHISKGEKNEVLRELRYLEKELGFFSENYNSSSFSNNVPE